MSRTGKPRHVHADLGDHPRDGLRPRGEPLGGLAKRAQHLVGLLLQFLHGGAQRVDLPQVQLQQETVVRRHPAVRGDDVRAVGFQAPGGAIGQPLGIGLPGDEPARIARPLTPRMSVTTCVNFTFASSSLLQAA